MLTIKKLKAGYKSFLSKYFKSDSPLYELLAKGQTPKVLMITCSDSRVDPAIILEAEPGDLFIVRNVANLVPTYTEDKTHHGTSTAIEYAVCHLGIKHIIVMGHSQCGGIQALIDQPEFKVERSFIPGWMEIAEPAIKRVLEEGEHDKYRRCEQASIEASIANLKTYPWVKTGLKDGAIVLHGWYFDISNGQILAFDDASKTFQPLL